MYTEKLADKVDKFNNTCHRTVNIKPIHVKTSTVFGFDVENNNKDLKYKVGDHVRISKGYTPNWSEDVFFIKQFKNSLPWTYVISDLNGENNVL